MHFDIKIKPSLIWRTDRECLFRILQNLLDNAAKYALDHSTIEITIDNTHLIVKNRCFFDGSLDEVKWPFSPGKRGKNAKNNCVGWGYGLCSVQLFAERILNWKCEFSQSRRQPESDKTDFSIIITRRV
jgi:K+-sensing histidine kinase KdpD